jgi:hypothetical protein
LAFSAESQGIRARTSRNGLPNFGFFSVKCIQVFLHDITKAICDKLAHQMAYCAMPISKNKVL